MVSNDDIKKKLADKRSGKIEEMDDLDEKTCPNCGAENPQDAEFCLKCGTSLADETVKAEIAEGEVELEKGLSLGEGIVICLFSPIAGAIAYLIWHDDKPKKAKQACIIALVAFFVVFVVVFGSQIIYRAYFAQSALDTESDIQTVRSAANAANMILTLL